MVINHLLAEMILQVPPVFFYKKKGFEPIFPKANKISR